MVVIERKEATLDISFGQRIVYLHEQLGEHVEAKIIFFVLGVAAVDCLEVELVHVDFVLDLANYALSFFLLLLFIGSFAFLQLLRLLRAVRFESHTVLTQELLE